MTTQSS